MAKLIANWNSNLQAWTTSQDSLFSERWELWQEVFPTSGMTVNGSLYELPTQERLIDAREYSSSLPGEILRSPKASEGEGGALGEAEALKRGNTVGVRDQVMDLVSGQGMKVSRVVDNLLPTTMSRDYKDSQAPHERNGVVQTDTVARAIFNSGEVLLPTTTASDWKGPNNSGSKTTSSNSISTVTGSLFPTLRASDGYERRNQKTMDKIAAEGGDLTMPTLARTTTDWGKFKPAVERWEAITRPAPEPTLPDGKNGAHRLSSRFTEWMMGLPDGWITGQGLKRNDELKMSGNGVVPQQAELALRLLLGDDIPKVS